MRRLPPPVRGTRPPRCAVLRRYRGHRVVPGMYLLMTATGVFTTERLTLRPWRIEDAPAALEVYGHAEVTRWLSPEMDQVRDHAAKIGTNAPMNTSAANGTASGTPSTASPMPSASTTATAPVART
ncbi:hypothetical protein SAMN04488000_13154 [Lentzea albida]|uniref:Acetyltransferase (GNAT) domain-containing protein n=1 Tax=Lentzea albida TaxID=65499 RepID=A0A1H9XC27_9PSEU|nr:hypothetical protein SAMN04488000_13154 [Lentzea albida]